jgi:hypothetical protein
MSQYPIANILRESFEDCLTRAMKAARVARAAAENTPTLEEKLRFLRMTAELDKAVKILRLHIYEYEDATDIVAALPDEGLAAVADPSDLSAVSALTRIATELKHEERDGVLCAKCVAEAVVGEQP